MNTIEVNSKVLASHLDSLRSVVERRTTIPALGYVLVESVTEDKIRLTATDLDNTLQVEVEHEGAFEGKFCAPLDRLHALTKALPESDIGISAQGNGWSELTTTSGVYKLAGIPVESFPDIQTGEGQSWECEGKDLLAGLSLVKHHAERGGEVSTYGRSEVLFEVNGCLRFVATTGPMMSICEVAPSQPFLSAGAEPLVSWTVPRKTVQAILRAFRESGKILCWATDNLLFFKQGTTKLTARRPDRPFTNYTKALTLIPAREVSIEKEEFRHTLSALAAFSEADQYKPANFDFECGSLKVTARTKDNEDAEETIGCGFKDAEPLAMRFDLLQVREAVRAAPSDVTLRVEQDKPLVILSTLDGLKTTQFIQPLSR